jgi:hypothetical protein
VEAFMKTQAATKLRSVMTGMAAAFGWMLRFYIQRPWKRMNALQKVALFSWKGRDALKGLVWMIHIV